MQISLYLQSLIFISKHFFLIFQYKNCKNTSNQLARMIYSFFFYYHTYLYCLALNMKMSSFHVIMVYISLSLTHTKNEETDPNLYYKK